MKIGFETWPYILKNCKTIFNKEPILEYVMGLECKYIIRRERKKAQIFFLKRLVIPFWRIIKKHFHITESMIEDFNPASLSKKEKIQDVIDKKFKKNYCIFAIWDSRVNYFEGIYDVLKKIDEMGEHSLLFTRYKVYIAKKKELSSLHNTSIIFVENLINYLTFIDIFKSYFNTHKLFNTLVRETTKEDIIKLEKKHKNEIIFIMENILLFSQAISKILKNKQCKFCFSLGGFFSLTAACKTLGIRTIMLQHGNFGNVTNHKEYTAMPPEFSPNADDEIILWGQKSLKQLQYIYNYDSSRKIFVLGNPRYDIVNSYLNKKRNKDFYEKLQIDSKKKTVTFFSSTHAIDIYQHEFFDRHVQPIYSLDQMIEKFISEINIVIKLHPLETKKYYEKYLKNISKVRIIKNEVLPFELYQHTDIAMSVSSTSLLEAMLFNIPTLQLIVTEYGERGELYYKQGAAILINNTSELLNTIEKIINNDMDLSDLEKNQKKYVEMNLTNLGNATDKIVEHLLKSKKLK